MDTHANRLEAVKRSNRRMLPEIHEAMLKSHQLQQMTAIESLHFYSQMSHESGGYRHLKELRTDTSAERKYGRHTRVGRILGNTQSGDGAKFKGRGIIQLTGRDNYNRAGRAVGVDLLKEPDKAADPELAVKIAWWYWTIRVDREAAQHDFKWAIRSVTKDINGGYNGLADRIHRYQSLGREYRKVGVL